MNGGFIKGTIFKIESKDYYLFDKTGKVIRCSLRGKFQKDFALKKDKLYYLDIAIVGDTVEFNLNKDGTGVIHKIQPRQNYISRKAPKIKGAGVRGERLEQVIASNLDNLVIVKSCKSPQFNNRLLDRLIVTGESSNINSVLVINKIDLDKRKHYKAWTELYQNIGYSVFETSVTENYGINELRDALKGKVNLFWGQSGVGKSSLLNLLYSNLDLKIGEVSQSTSKGKHTTVTVFLIKTDEDTFVIDTPGIREIDPYGIRKKDLGHYFKDFTKYSINCRFNTCTHHHEPDCGVMKAHKEGLIKAERYKSYLNILETIEDDMIF